MYEAVVVYRWSTDKVSMSPVFEDRDKAIDWAERILDQQDDDIVAWQVVELDEL